MITIEIERQTLQRLQEHAEPLLDTPDTVIKRLLDVFEGTARQRSTRGGGRSNSPERAAKGEKTPNEAFYDTIVQVLKEAGGELRTGDAVDRVGKLMRSKLNEVDMGELKTGEPRWRNTVRWARNDLVNQGVLDPDAPHGTWRLKAGR